MAMYRILYYTVVIMTSLRGLHSMDWLVDPIIHINESDDSQS